MGIREGDGDRGRGNSEIAGSWVRGMISAEEKSQRNRVEFLRVRKGMEVSRNVRRWWASLTNSEMGRVSAGHTRGIGRATW